MLQLKKIIDFSLEDQSGNVVSLDDFKGKYVVLYFYPKDDTPSCTTEALDFTRHKDEFDKLNTVVIGISQDSCISHQEFIQKHNLSVILLSDPGSIVTKDYGAWGKKTKDGVTTEGVIRTTVIISPEKTLAHEWFNVKVNGHVEEVLKFLKEQ